MLSKLLPKDILPVDRSQPILVFTGGHHTSSLVLAKKLRQRGWHIIWFGHRHSQWGDKSDSAEYREVKAAGIGFIDLRAGKIYRTYHPLKLIRLPLGFLQSLYYLSIIKLCSGNSLRGIVSFGGYLAVPVVICGWLLSVPSLTHEQTLTSGWANRIISLFAQKIAVTWPSSLNHFPKDKVILTGMPLRPEIVKTAGRKKSPVRNLIYVTGGKQGSHIINQAVFDALPELLKKYTVVHQTGSSTIYSDHLLASEIRDSLPSGIRSRYQVHKYLPAASAAEILHNSKVVVSRSGAHIVHELMYFQKNSVLIPISWSSHDEQYKNARLMADHGLAVILPESELTGESLLGTIDRASLLKPVNVPDIRDGLDKLVKLTEAEFSPEVGA